MVSSRNAAVSFIATKALHNTVGIFSRNRNFLSVQYQDGRLIWDFLVPLQHALGSGDEPRVEQIRELIRATDGAGVIENVPVEDITLLLDYVSTYWRLCYVWIKNPCFTKGIGWYGFDWLWRDRLWVFSLVLCLNCANLHVPCCNWLRINTICLLWYFGSNFEKT